MQKKIEHFKQIALILRKKIEGVININRFTSNKVVIKDKLIFAGGNPKFKWVPDYFTWGSRISFVWLGTEMVYLGKRKVYK